MAITLRDLLIQRAARLQERPALTAADWGTLSYAQFRNRVEGVALGILAEGPPPSLFSATGTPWDWIAEVATAASGLTWAPTGQTIPPAVFGGPRFNHEGGRGPYHAKEQTVVATSVFCPGMTQGELLLRLRRLNGRLAWDHTTRVVLPAKQLAEPPLRAALWSALFAGAHAVLEEELPASRALFRRSIAATPAWDGSPFMALWGT